MNFERVLKKNLFFLLVSVLLRWMINFIIAMLIHMLCCTAASSKLSLIVDVDTSIFRVYNRGFVSVKPVLSMSVGDVTKD